MNWERSGELALYGWWLVFNGWIHYLEVDFLCTITRKSKRRWALLWIGFNEILVAGKLWGWLPNVFFLHIWLLALWLIVVFRLPWKLAAAPLVIVGTLYTLIEGYSAVCMYWVSRNIRSVQWGMTLQILIGTALAAVYFWILRMVRRRYSDALQWPVSLYLYMLLFPCGFMAVLVRLGLRLDSIELEQYFLAVGIHTGMAVFLMLSGAMAVFLMMINVFSVIVEQAQRESDMLALKVQLDGQKTYMKEAEKRNREYAKFQHDIHNHLLVLEGLIKDKKYEKAEQYMGKLRVGSQTLTTLASTGNGALDVLLKEKLSYGRSNGIEMVCGVRIPEEFGFDDMDLVIIFANILDNAIEECIGSNLAEKEIFLYTKTHGRFLVIESVNSSAGRPIEEGIGLMNVKRVAERYQGMVEISNTENGFRISVLLRGVVNKEL